MEKLPILRSLEGLGRSFGTERSPASPPANDQEPTQAQEPGFESLIRAKAEVVEPVSSPESSLTEPDGSEFAPAPATETVPELDRVLSTNLSIDLPAPAPAPAQAPALGLGDEAAAAEDARELALVLDPATQSVALPEVGATSLPPSQRSSSGRVVDSFGGRPVVDTSVSSQAPSDPSLGTPPANSETSNYTESVDLQTQINPQGVTQGEATLQTLLGTAIANNVPVPQNQVPIEITQSNGTADVDVRFASPTVLRSEEVNAGSVMGQVRVLLNPVRRSATIDLYPRELGRVSVDIAIHNGEVEARFRVEQQGAFDVIEKHIPELRAELARQGLDVRNVDVSLIADDRAGANDASAEWGSGRAPNESRQSDPSGTEDAKSSDQEILIGGHIGEDGVDTYA